MNRIDYRDYTEGPQRWAVCSPNLDAAVRKFKAWGAKDWFFFGGEFGTVQPAMVLLEDGAWRYAHLDTSYPGSIYCDEKVRITANTGEEAVRIFEAIRVIDNWTHVNNLYESALKALHESIEKLPADFQVEEFDPRRNTFVKRPLKGPETEVSSNSGENR